MNYEFMFIGGTSVDPEPLPQPAPVQNTPIRPSSDGVVSRPKGSRKMLACTTIMTYLSAYLEILCTMHAQTPA